MRRASTGSAHKTNFCGDRNFPEIQSDSDYGFDVVLSKDQSALVVSAPKHCVWDYNGQEKRVGAVFVYEKNLGNLFSEEKYILTQVLLHPTLQNNSFFGYSLALSADGNRLLVSAFAENEGCGAVHVYNRRGGDICFIESQNLVSSEANSISFGVYVDISPDGNVATVTDSFNVELFLFDSLNLNFKAEKIICPSDARVSKFLGKDVVVNPIASVSVSENGQYIALGVPHLALGERNTGAVIYIGVIGSIQSGLWQTC